MKEDDVLRVRCDLEKFQKIQEREGILFKPQYKWSDEDIETADTKLVEAVIAPNMDFVGKTLQKLKFRENFGASVLALRHRGRLMIEKISDTKLNAGDALADRSQNRSFHQSSAKSFIRYYFGD